MYKRQVQYARHSAWYENLSADVEAFARPLWGLVPFWAGGGENETFEKLYITGITSGADKKNDGYWGDCHDKDQRFVEMAAFAYGLIFAPEKVWEPLTSTAKNNFEKWLYSINDKEVCDSNWTFFRVLVNVALKKVGRKYSQEQLDKDIARIDEFYLGNGWYIDGLHGQKDYYIGFAFHFYGLIYAVAMEDDDKERSCLLYTSHFRTSRRGYSGNIFMLCRLLLVADIFLAAIGASVNCIAL